MNGLSAWGDSDERFVNFSILGGGLYLNLRELINDPDEEVFETKQVRENRTPERVVSQDRAAVRMGADIFGRGLIAQSGIVRHPGQLICLIQNGGFV